jgi:hypothetical protein
MNRDKKYLVYFTPQKDENDRYRVLISGKETDVYLAKHDIMKILTASQFKEFVKEMGIFEIEHRVLEPYLKHEPQDKNHKDRWKPV